MRHPRHRSLVDATVGACNSPRNAALSGGKIAHKLHNQRLTYREHFRGRERRRRPRAACDWVWSPTRGWEVQRVEDVMVPGAVDGAGGQRRRTGYQCHGPGAKRRTAAGNLCMEVPAEARAPAVERVITAALGFRNLPATISPPSASVQPRIYTCLHVRRRQPHVYTHTHTRELSRG